MSRRTADFSALTLVILLCAVTLGASPVALGRRTSSSLPDTVEIYAFKVEFAFEEPDNSLTTGRGVFDSDGDTLRANYSLDPQGARRTNRYWEKQLDFVSHWYKSVSRGKVIVRHKVFPEGGGTYRLNDQMIDYNRTTQKKDEKTVQFDSSKVVDYLRFARDVIRTAAASTDSPFSDPEPRGGRTHRLYMAIHAGANRLLDGGSLGTLYADTPGDFTDMMIERDDFKWLRDIDSARGDTLGIALQGMGVDTVTSLMVISETASQDGLNWGVQGSVVHQLARAMGLPIAYDAVKGISRTGWFDMLDFAGYSTANGFLPVYPNPWARLWMGWDEAVEAQPGEDGMTATYSLKAVSDTTPGGIRILKIPLNGGEYLLIENRQRSADPQGKVTLRTDLTEKTVPSDSLDQFFLDTLCNAAGKNCKPNTKKGRGVMQSATSYDAGLPGSGIAVWKVNDWYIDRVLRYGYINATQEGGLSDHYLGVQLLQASGVLTIGREFRDSYGNEVYDYGSGGDLLPHISISPAKKRDTVTAITPYTYATTNSSNNGLTHLSLSAAIPPKGRKEKSVSPLTGDSIITFAAPVLEVTVDWRGLIPKYGKFPVRVAPSSPTPLLSPLSADPSSQETAVMAVGERGHLQPFNPRGEPLAPLSDSLPYRAGYDSVTTLLDDPSLGSTARAPIYAAGSPAGEVIGMAVWESVTASLHQRVGKTENLLRFTSPPASEGGTWTTRNLSVRATLGPMVWKGALWIASPDSVWKLDRVDGKLQGWKWPKTFSPHALAGVADRDGTGEAGVVAIGDTGRIAFLPIDGTPKMIGRPLSRLGSREFGKQKWRIAVSDFHRSGSDQMVAVGSYGTLFFADLSSGELLGEAQTVARGRGGTPSALGSPLYHDTTSLAVADLDGDGYPEVVFTGHNSLYAVNRHNTTLEGFPFRYRGELLEGHLLERPWIPGKIGSAPLLVDVTGDDLPEILSATPAGLLYAVDYRGKEVESSIGGGAVDQSGGALRRSSDWPLAVGSLSLGDSLRHPYIQLVAGEFDREKGTELYALSYDRLFGWSFPKGKISPNRWLSEGGGAERHNRFDPSALSTVTSSARQKILKFHLYPSPLKTPRGNFLIELGDDAKGGRIRILDVTGAVAFDKTLGELKRGVNRLQSVDLSSLGSDVYSILLEIDFGKGKKDKKWSRAGVIR